MTDPFLILATEYFADKCPGPRGRPWSFSPRAGPSHYRQVRSPRLQTHLAGLFRPRGVRVFAKGHGPRAAPVVPGLQHAQESAGEWDHEDHHLGVKSYPPPALAVN